MNAPSWVSSYVGIPYRQGGLSETGCSCWGLVRLILQNECHLDLPTYGEVSASDMLAAALMDQEASSDYWRKIPSSEIRAFDVVHMFSFPTIGGRIVRTKGHCGILINPERVLHVWEEPPKTSVHVPLDHSSIRRRILGFYRHALI